MIKKYLSVAILFLSVQNLAAQVPAISSFSPASGTIGTTVTINGTNFSTTAINNIVYFGAVRATVTNATTSTLKVTVPAGASYLPITITVNGLTGYSAKPFDVTFTGYTHPINQNSFATQTNFSVNPIAGSSIVYCADFDGDGKPDVLTYYYETRSTVYKDDTAFAISRNISKVGTINFAPSITISTKFQPLNCAIADINGDGKLDFVLTSTTQFYVFKNTSIPGAISFAAPVSFPLSYNLSLYDLWSSNIVISDFDKDGKPDIALVSFPSSNSYLSIFKNQSDTGTIAFTNSINYTSTTDEYYFRVYATDLNDDLYPDLVIAGDNSLTVLRNTSRNYPGAIKFVTDLDETITPNGDNDFNLGIADIDNDGKTDILMSKEYDTTKILRNISNAGGTISFAPPTIYPYNFYQISDASADDINGDGKPDFIFSEYQSPWVQIVPNLTTSVGNISLSDTVNFWGTWETTSDLDGDGKPDIVLGSSASTFAVLRNKIGEPVNVNFCPPSGSATFTTDITGTTYQWQVSADSVNFTNISNNTIYSGATTNTLQLTNIPSSSNANKYRCVVDGNNSDLFALRFTDTWIGTTNSLWANASNWSCGVVPDANTDVIINSGKVILSSNTAVRSISINPSASFTIVTPYNLTVTH